MKQNRKFVTAGILAAVILLAAIPAASFTYDGLDAGSSDAGASKALSSYCSDDPTAEEVLANYLQPLITQKEKEKAQPSEEQPSEDVEEFSYAEPLTGVVCVPSALNMRATTSVLSEVVAQVFREYEILIIGEAVVNGRTWYRVGIFEGEHIKTGYVLADYVKVGEEAEAYFAELHEQEKSAAEMPEALTVNQYDNASEEALYKLDEPLRLINYSLKNDYNPNPGESSYMNRYAVLSYLIELYQNARAIAEEYELNETLARINRDLYSIVLTRENLVDESGVDETLLQQQIMEAQAERKEKQRLSLGESIADYAASFVGTLPYVWGGASLRSGADCSGFAAQIYAHFGLLDQGAANVHAYDSYALRSVGVSVNLSQIQPGDLVCYNGHVAIYYGGGVCVNEPAIGRRCSFDSLYMLPIVSIRRLQ